MSNLVARLLTAGALIPLLLLAINWQNPIAVWGIVFLATLAGLREFYNMTMPKEPLFERGFAIALGMAFAASLYWYGGEIALATLTGATLLAFLYSLFAYREMESVARRVTAMWS